MGHLERDVFQQQNISRVADLYDYSLYDKVVAFYLITTLELKGTSMSWISINLMY